MSVPQLGRVLVASVILAAVHCGDGAQEADVRQSSHEPRILEAAPAIFPMPEGVEPTPLIGEFDSLIGLEEALERTRGLPYETSMNKTTAERGTCPGQHLLEVMVNRYEDLGIRGTLFLTFYDGKLARVWFKTGDHDRYRQRYTELHGIERRNRWLPSFVPPATRILAAVLGNQGIIVRDTRAWANVTTTEKACRFQRQLERGLTSAAAN